MIVLPSFFVLFLKLQVQVLCFIQFKEGIIGIDDKGELKKKQKKKQQYRIEISTDN